MSNALLVIHRHERLVRSEDFRDVVFDPVGRERCGALIAAIDARVGRRFSAPPLQLGLLGH